MDKIILITQIKSSIGRIPKHRATILGLGLKRIGHTVKRLDNPSIWGMINKISYMVQVRRVKNCI